MQNSKFIVIITLFLGLTFSAFQCSSTEMTSAKLYIQQKNYEKALESLKKEVAKNPKNDEAYYYLGVVYGEQKQYKESQEALDKSLAISKKFETDIKGYKLKFWSDLFNQGVTYFQRASSGPKDSAQMNYTKSMESFQQAIEFNPDSASTYKNLAFVYINAGKTEEAVAPLQKLIEKEKSADGYKLLGEIYYTQGSQQKELYSSSNNPQDSVKALEYFNKAITILEEGRKLYPNDSELLLTLSNSYIGANKIDVAIDAFKAGVEQEPSNPYYRYNYGVLLLGSNQFVEAEEQFKKAIEIKPDYQNAIYNLAVTYVRWGAQINKDAEEKGIMDNVEYKKKYELALPYLEKVVETNSTDAAIWELLGRVYTILGMQDDATTAFNKADSLRK